jgi:type I restriction enzyme S subunit
MLWHTKKLSELCQIELGKTPYRGNDRFWDKEKQTNNVWLSIADLLNTEGNIIFDSKEYISDKGAELSKIVEKGTLLVSFKLTLGRLAFAGKDLYTNEAIAALTIKNEKEISKDYLYHYLSFFDWHGAVKGDAKVKGWTLNKAKLKEIEILYPESLSEQRRIVKILDEVFEGIKLAKENTEKNLRNSKELFEFYLQEVFAKPGKDWKEKKLADVCNFFNGKAHEKYIDEKGNYIVVNSKFISSDGKKYKKTKKQLFPLIVGDIVMVMSDVPKGKALMKSFLVDVDNLYTLNQRICAIRSKNFDNKFLHYQLNRNKYFLSFDNGENQTNLRKNDILNCPLLIPTLSEQKAIVAKLDALAAETGKLEGIYKQKLEDLEELKKSVLQSAFAGKL